MSDTTICGDCLTAMKVMQPQSVDLVFGSPPYEDARTYGIDFSLKGQAWVDWMVDVYKESLRVCRGLVAFVVEGRTRHFSWSATPVLLMADLHRAGITIRKPPIYERDGIPGSGGPDWLKNRYEFVVCATNGGRLPWSDNIACGEPPRYKPGGDPTHRRKSGNRVRVPCFGGYTKDAPHAQHGGQSGIGSIDEGITRKNGRIYQPPQISNPGNIINCGANTHFGKYAHENEAPFPEALADFFVRSFCPPNGIVLDPFAGSGTVAAVAKKTGRNSISIDIRPSQVELIGRRLAEIPELP